MIEDEPTRGNDDGGDARARGSAAGGEVTESSETTTEPADDRIERTPIGTRADDREGDAGDAADAGGILGPEASSTPVEAESPSLEHALFVVLGALGMVLVFVRLVQVSLGV